MNRTEILAQDLIESSIVVIHLESSIYKTEPPLGKKRSYIRELAHNPSLLKPVPIRNNPHPGSIRIWKGRLYAQATKRSARHRMVHPSTRVPQTHGLDDGHFSYNKLLLLTQILGGFNVLGSYPCHLHTTGKPSSAEFRPTLKMGRTQYRRLNNGIRITDSTRGSFITY